MTDRADSFKSVAQLQQGLLAALARLEEAFSAARMRVMLTRARAYADARTSAVERLGDGVDEAAARRAATRLIAELAARERRLAPVRLH